MKNTSVTISHIAYSYHSKEGNKHVLDDINFEIHKGDFITIFGPNGSGKTTLLNIIAGFIKPITGYITYSKKKHFKISYIFQNYRESLFPWMTVYDNIAYPLKVKKVPEKEIRKKVLALYKKFGVQFDLYTYPYLLSGGQQQMVAIMRGFIEKPDLILMDEPFASLDYQTTLHLEQKLQE